MFTLTSISLNIAKKAKSIKKQDKIQATWTLDFIKAKNVSENVKGLWIRSLDRLNKLDK